MLELNGRPTCNVLRKRPVNFIETLTVDLKARAWDQLLSWTHVALSQPSRQEEPCRRCRRPRMFFFEISTQTFLNLLEY